MMELKTRGNQEFIDQLDDLSKCLIPAHAPGWLEELRARGMSRFRDLGLPSVKEEDWKYTDISALTEQRYVLAQSPHLIERDALTDYLGADEISVVFVNGLFSQEFSRLARVPAGVTIRTLTGLLAMEREEAKDLFAEAVCAGESSFAALNKALMQNAACIRIDGNALVKKNIHIVHVTSGADKYWVVAPRTLIKLGRHAQASISESHIAFADTNVYFADALTDIVLSENASLQYCKAQKESLKAFHIGNTYVRQAAHSNFHSFSFAAGAALTRDNLEVVLNGEGANAVLNGLYSVYKEQHVDNHTSVDHKVPHGTSHQLYKGILNDSARAVFNGKIFVRAAAQGTNSYQLNKNLLLGKNCRVDTKPQLEIFADDVRCSHGATIGQLNPEEIFYLQSRCISAQTATKLLTRGFADDIINTIQDEKIRQKLTGLLEPAFEALA
jgi:Fe-S cluster assembly protein SufD